MSEWDLAAVQVIVEEAGTYLGLLGRRADDGRGAITSNGLLHDELVRAVAGRASLDSDLPGSTSAL